MIVSHKHRFIFIKTRKTAGTSIEVALSRIAGDDAIVTPLAPPEPLHEPRNYSGSWRQTLRWVRANPRGSGHSLLQLARDARVDRHCDFYNHMPAWLIRAQIGHDVWEEYFKFCFERNPWDKVASLYFWLARDCRDLPPFEEWLFSAPDVVSDWPLYSLDQECAVNAVGQYEKLNADLKSFLERVAAPINGVVLPQAKGGVRRDGCLYSPSAMEYVRRTFHHEVEMFGYSCPPELLL